MRLFEVVIYKVMLEDDVEYKDLLSKVFTIEIDEFLHEKYKVIRDQIEDMLLDVLRKILYNKIVKEIVFEAHEIII